VSNARDEALLAASVNAYLALSLGFGVHLATYLVVAAAVVALWILACGRWPWFALFTAGFIRGLFGMRRR
jgi:hypothetical protein